jgi:hypothetical protein
MQRIPIKEIVNYFRSILQLFLENFLLRKATKFTHHKSQCWKDIQNCYTLYYSYRARSYQNCRTGDQYVHVLVSCSTILQFKTVPLVYEPAQQKCLCFVTVSVYNFRLLFLFRRGQLYLLTARETSTVK